MNGTTVARHLYRAFAVFVALVLASGVIATVTAWQQFRSITSLTEQVLPERLANAQLHGLLGDAQRGARTYLLTGDVTMDEVYRQASGAYPATAARLRRLAPPEDGPAVQKQLDQAAAWFNLADRLRVASPGTSRAVALANLGRANFNAFLVANGGLDASLADRGERLRARTRATESVAIAAMLATTLLGVLAAVLVAIRTGRRINRPLGTLLSTLSRLRSGDLSARAAVTGPADIRAVAETLNSLSDENEQSRLAARSRARLREAARTAGMRIREHLSVDEALDTTAQILGLEFEADLVVVRLVDEQRPRSVCWPPDRDDPLAGAPIGWLADRYANGEVWRCRDLRGDGNGAPEAERAGLLAAGAVGVLTVPFGTGDEPDGAITLVRLGDGAPWQQSEAEAAGWVAGDVARGVQQSRMYEQEQRLVAELRELDRSKTDFLSHRLARAAYPADQHQRLRRAAVRPGHRAYSSDDQQSMLEVIERNTDRLRVLIEDLLTLSRIESGTFKTVRQPTDVTNLVDRGCPAIRPTARGRPDHHRGLPARPARRRGRPAPDRPGTDQPAVQRGQVHPGRRFGDDTRRRGRGRPGLSVCRHRYRHPARRAAGPVHPVLPGVQRAWIDPAVPAWG